MQAFILAVFIFWMTLSNSCQAQTSDSQILPKGSEPILLKPIHSLKDIDVELNSQTSEIRFEGNEVTDEVVEKALAKFSNFNNRFKGISIENTRCSGKVFALVIKCSNLESLIADIKTVSSTDIAHLTKLQKLKKLDLYLPQGVVFEPLVQCEKLKDLTLVTDFVSSSTIDWLTSLNQIETLGLEINNHQNTNQPLKTSLNKLVHLKILSLYGNGITDVMLAAFSDTPQLQRINLTYTSCTDTGLKSLSKCRVLTNLDFIGNRYINFSGLKYLKQCPISTIDIITSQTDKMNLCASLDFSALKEFKSLQGFSVNPTHQSHIELIQFIWKLPNISKLNIQQISLSDSDERMLKTMKQLRLLHIHTASIEQDNKIREALPNCHIRSSRF